eukprot:CAMPEP_0181226072 /NCGR_PEP_ID=MMETSP1096-20121128/32058_1 /TAXON_ID=156174 ORGANISM="Chrysochromulina ericina, Strain CCMP281" /NCGR_SAMPLE_ID=MMETSP1096 /ASSEMBLY_ACC=CAM_ASM_000453 /LENGTH=33 /DNA_ID= /DNA_START= /DNA_END= /DNA_ORIENTATION=
MMISCRAHGAAASGTCSHADMPALAHANGGAAD